MENRWLSFDCFFYVLSLPSGLYSFIWETMSMKNKEWERNQALVTQMQENKKAKIEKATPVDPSQIEFSKEEGKDFFVELCAAEEVIGALRKDIAMLENQLHAHGIRPREEMRQRDQLRYDPFEGATIQWNTGPTDPTANRRR